MKKSLMFLITVTLVIAAFVIAGSASAGQHHQGRAVFEADIVPVGTHPLDNGRVAIRNNGEFKVKIKGAVETTDYDVYLVYVDSTDTTQDPLFLGALSTNKKGNGKLFGEVCVGQDVVRMPWIEIYMSGEVPDVDDPQYVSGFAPVLCDDPPVDDPPDGDSPDGGSGGVLGDLPGL